MRPSASCQCADLIQILFEEARIKYPEFDHAFPSPLDQPTVNQFSEVVARQSLADAERFGDVNAGQLPFGNEADHPQARRVSQDGQDAREALDINRRARLSLRQRVSHRALRLYSNIYLTI